MNYWLIKTEPAEFAFADLLRQPARTECWGGVRNYQARNFLRAMAGGDLAFVYHSSCPEPGVAGVVRIARPAYPDPTALDRHSAYYDPASTAAAPRWVAVDVTWHADLPRFVTLADLRADRALRELIILRRGNRLSVTPLLPAEFHRICWLAGLP